MAKDHAWSVIEQTISKIDSIPRDEVEAETFCARGWLVVADGLMRHGSKQTDHEVDPDVASALTSAKSVLAIVNGLILTNTTLVLITSGHYSHIVPLGKLGMENIAFAAILMANVVRFYHGNVRHLDAAYGSESVLRAASGRHMEPRGGLGVDFLVIFTQSVLFSVTSFYILAHVTYVSLFIVLLGFDIIWAVYSEPSHADRTASPQRMWLLNNLGAITALVVCFLLYKAHHRIWALDAAVGVLAVTTILDFALNWGFYFPSRVRRWRAGEPLNVFLSAPLTQFVNGDHGRMEKFRTQWTHVVYALERYGHNVFSAHEREAWGADLDDPESALTADLEGLQKCDLVVAYVGEPPSPGVQMELGYAIARHKRILTFIKRGQTEPYLVHGLTVLASVEVVEIDHLGEISAELARKGLIKWPAEVVDGRAPARSK
jgi:Nucleoside 2-deoxyribosyltransferase